MTKPTPKRWFRFSLRTLLVAIAAVCILLGWKMNQVQRQRRAVARVESLGYGVLYDHEIHGRPHVPPGPAGIRKLAGDDFFARVAYIAIEDREFTDVSPLADFPYLSNVTLVFTGVTDFTPLAELEYVQELDLTGSPVSDLTPVRHMTSVDELFLGKTNVQDVTAVANLTNMEKMSLSDTQVSEVSALSGMLKLSWLDLSRTQVTDLSPLANLPNLRELRIRETPVSDEEVEELQQALPNLKISR